MALAARLDHAVGAARTLTVGAVLDPLGGDLFLAAEGRFLEGQLQPCHDVFAPAGRILLGAAAAAAAAKELAENVSQVAEAVKSAESGAAKAGAAVARAACAEVGVNPGKAVLVIPRPLVGIGQHLIGFSGLLELFLGGLVAGVAVGVVFHGGLAVGLLYVVGAGVLINAQHLIVISFGICHTQFTSFIASTIDSGQLTATIKNTATFAAVNFQLPTRENTPIRGGVCRPLGIRI